MKKQADLEAIAVFSENLRELLLAAPLGQKRTMALDPGFRTGAKLVCLGNQGELLHFTTIYPALSQKQREEAAQTVIQLCERYHIEAIAIGNGTAGRETESFVRALELPPEVVVTMVDESGASIYSASEVARAEFPDHDITVRGAVSIGRRLQDPLAELVKLDPKAIGVGQYQHDVNQKALKQSLEDVVISCVNKVGVEVNSASKELLTFVSGLGKHWQPISLHTAMKRGRLPTGGNCCKFRVLAKRLLSNAPVFYVFMMGKIPWIVQGFIRNDMASSSKWPRIAVARYLRSWRMKNCDNGLNLIDMLMMRLGCRPCMTSWPNLANRGAIQGNLLKSLPLPQGLKN